MTATIAVDFDGVIHAYSKGWHDGTIYDDPVPGALDGLLALRDAYAVFIFTSRDPAAVAAWLMRHTEMPLCVDGSGSISWWPRPLDRGSDRHTVLITNRKLPAVAYIDDRAIHFTSWDDTLAEVRRREAAAR